VASTVKQNISYELNLVFRVFGKKGEDSAAQGNIRCILYEAREVPIEHIYLSLTSVRFILWRFVA
jgi:hypothetical protein